MEETAFVAGKAEVKIVAVPGERKRDDRLGSGSDNLSVAASRNVAEPKAVEPFSRMAISRNFPSGEMAVRRVLPEMVAAVMEYLVKGRGAFGERKERSVKPPTVSSARTATAASNAEYEKRRLAGIAGGGIAAPDCGTGMAGALEEDCGGGAESADPVAILLRPEPVSRLRRFKSVRMSEACWYRRSRSFSMALMMSCSNSTGRLLLRRTAAAGALWRMASKMAPELSPWKGREPVAIS